MLQGTRPGHKSLFCHGFSAVRDMGEPAAAPPGPAPCNSAVNR